MYIAIHDDETTYIGVTNREYISGQPEDSIPEGNLPIATGKRGEGIMIATDGFCAAADMIRNRAKKLSGKIDGKRMINEIKPMVKECHEYYNQTDKDGHCKTLVLVGTKEGLYEISGGAVSKTAFVTSDYESICKCAYLSSEGKPSVERILYIFREAERMRNISLFPISIYDVRTGKRRIYRR